MKRIYTFLFLIATALTVSAQSLSFSPGTTASANLYTGSEVPIYIYIDNNLNYDIDIGWELVQNGLHPNWDVTICDANFCYFGVHQGDTMGPIGAGQKGFLKPGVTVNASDMVSGSITYNVWVVGDKQNTQQELVFLYNATVSAEEAMESNEIRIYPNPVTNILTLAASNGNLEMGTVTVFDLQGAEMMRREIKDPEAMRLDVHTLPVGSYFVRYETETQTLFKQFVKTN